MRDEMFRKNRNEPVAYARSEYAPAKLVAEMNSGVCRNEGSLVL